jgi:hypothetical protein
VSFTGISIYRLAGGRIVEDWVSRDTHGLRRQFAARARLAPVAPGRRALRWCGAGGILRSAPAPGAGLRQDPSPATRRPPPW